MSLLVIVAMAFAAGAAATTPQQQYYKWTDAQGTVHFSAKPPEGRKASVVKVEGDARAEPPAPQPAAAPTSELEQTEAEYRKQSCAAARNDLKLLDSGQMVVQGDSAATATKLNAEQRAKAKAAAKARVAQFCLDK